VVLRENDELVNLLSFDDSKAHKGGRHPIALEPYGYRWFRVGRNSYLSRRRDY